MNVIINFICSIWLFNRYKKGKNDWQWIQFFWPGLYLQNMIFMVLIYHALLGQNTIFKQVLKNILHTNRNTTHNKNA